MWIFRDEPVPRLADVTSGGARAVLRARRHRVDPGGLRVLVDEHAVGLLRWDGRTLATLEPGENRFDLEEVRYLCGGAADPVVQTWFVSTDALAGLPFGGRVDDLDDPESAAVASLRVRGQLGARIADAALLVDTLEGTVDLPNDEAFLYWVAKQALRSARRTITRAVLLDRTPVLRIPALAPELQRATGEALDGELAAHGMARIGEVSLQLVVDEDDAERLRAAPPCPACGHPALRRARYCIDCGEALTPRER